MLSNNTPSACYTCPLCYTSINKLYKLSKLNFSKLDATCAGCILKFENEQMIYTQCGHLWHSNCLGLCDSIINQLYNYDHNESMLILLNATYATAICAICNEDIIKNSTNTFLFVSLEGIPYHRKCWNLSKSKRIKLDNENI